MERNIFPELDSLWGEARFHVLNREYQKAVEIYKYLLIMYSDRPYVQEFASAYLGEVYLSMQCAEAAVPHIQKAISCHPQKPAYHYLLGIAYSRQRKWKKAIEELEIAIQKEPRRPEYLRSLGWAIYNTGEVEKSLGYLHKADELGPDNVAILSDLSAVYLGLLDFKKARYYIQKALEIDPTNTLAQSIASNLEYLQGQYKIDTSE